MHKINASSVQCSQLIIRYKILCLLVMCVQILIACLTTVSSYGTMFNTHKNHEGACRILQFFVDVINTKNLWNNHLKWHLWDS